MARLARSIRRQVLRIVMFLNLIICILWLLSMYASMDRVVWIGQLLNSLWE